MFFTQKKLFSEKNNNFVSHLRFSKLPENSNGKHNYSQHHHQHCGLPAPTPGVTHRQTDPQFWKSLWFYGFHLSRFKESISDFYWYYSGKDVIDEAGQRNFSKALSVAKQVFNSLTEYIQVSHMITCGWFNNKTCLCGFKACCVLHAGSMYWESAESGSQQAVGCSGRFPACFCQHADEVISG